MFIELPKIELEEVTLDAVRMKNMGLYIGGTKHYVQWLDADGKDMLDADGKNILVS